eukprot:m.83350 g.83350  ORF g.83350 m.83350 type:complete len:441 (+) comp12918_c0_seq2:169-1491(+)
MVSRAYHREVLQTTAKVQDNFTPLGIIGEGTYGIVYKAHRRNKDGRDTTDQLYALKGMKGSAQGAHDGLSISVCREIGLLKELKHENIIHIREIYLDHKERNVWLLFHYAEYDLWSIISFHNKQMRNHNTNSPSPPDTLLTSVLWQTLTGIHYLHSNWVLHRDVKPANILVMGPDTKEYGRVKIGDLGMARLFNAPLKPLSSVDPVVVTFWYRAPELLLGAKHYTKAVDVWAVGCIMAELMTSKPLFHSKNVDTSKDPYHQQQLFEIFKIMGVPVNVDYQPRDQWEWRGMRDLPNYDRLQQDLQSNYFPTKGIKAIGLEDYIRDKKGNLGSERVAKSKLSLLSQMLRLDPQNRISAHAALKSKYFQEQNFPRTNIFEGMEDAFYPKREIKNPEHANKDKTKNNGKESDTKPWFPSNHQPTAKRRMSETTYQRLQKKKANY